MSEKDRMTDSVRYQQFTAAARLMALLLAVLLLIGSLPGHAVMDDSCAVDCGASQVEMLDHTGADCGVCAPLTASPRLPGVLPDAIVYLADLAVIEFLAPPPREPPKS